MTREERLARDGVTNPILFYGTTGPWGVFSNFSRHGIWLPHPWTGEFVFYKTSEHRFACMKATSEEDHDYVLAASSPGQAKARGREIMLIDGWNSNHRGFAYYAMFEALVAKTLQHEEASDAVRESGSRHIYEDSPTDDIWGWRYQQDHRGKNLLGRGWMAVRALAGQP